MVYYGVKHHGLYAVGSDSKRTDLGPSYRDASISLLFCIFRYVYTSYRDSYSLLLLYLFFKKIGMFVTSASFIVYGKAIWNPITLIATIDQRYLL